MRSKPLTFQFPVVVVVREAYKVLTQDRVSTAQVVEQIVDIPFLGGLPGFFPRQRSSQRTVEQLVDIPVPGGGLHVPLLDPGGVSVFGSFAG